MALGDQVGEASGKITGTRVLTPVGEQVQMEVSFQGSGNMLGEEITDTATYVQVVRPGGVFYGEGNALSPSAVPCRPALRSWLASTVLPS